MWIKGENPLKIIRWRDTVTLPSGERGYMCSRIGSMQEVVTFAEKIAKENATTVEVVV